MKKCLIEVPADQSSVILRDEYGTVIFNGDDFAAARISNVIPPIVGGNTHYIFLHGTFVREEGKIIITLPDAYDLDSVVEVEIYLNTISRISIFWTVCNEECKSC